MKMQQPLSIMFSFATILPLSLLAITQARSLPPKQIQARAKGIEWAPCPAEINAWDPNNRTFQCASLDVPLDYTEKSSDKKLSLDLIRIPALKEPKKGSILFNWGGPGGDGVVNMASAAALVQP
jgi:hypothetical protein